MIYVFLGATVALFIALCMLAVGCVVRVLTGWKVVTPSRLLAMMALLAPVFLIYDVFSDRSCNGFYNYAVSGYLITAVVVSLSWSRAAAATKD